MTSEEARYSPLKNRITQALGSPTPITLEYNEHSLTKGDKVLLCSDGLWNMLSDEEIRAIVMRKGTLKEICEKLIEKANNR
ncbi:MAG: hypothetical protein HY731_11800 [Candidatus Tectomicrobia bacterium]|nr:hypothetical protein [Candidatus Tectomicrobia bacterium]